MPIPSFDELLDRARQVADSQAEARNPRTGELIAKGVSDFANQLLFKEQTPKKLISGSVSPTGSYQPYDKTYTTGGSLMDKLLTGTPPATPAGSIPVSPEQAADFGIKSSLERVKQTGRESLARIRANAIREASGQKILAQNQRLGQATSDAIWAKLGYDTTTQAMPILTYGEADRVLRAENIDTNAELRGLGYEIAMGKDILGQVEPGTKESVKAKLQGMKDRQRGQGQNKTIRVRLKADGKTGTIPENEFDSNIYERL